MNLNIVGDDGTLTTHLITEHYIYYLVNNEFLSNTDLFPNKAYEVYDNTSIEHKGKEYAC